MSLQSGGSRKRPRLGLTLPARMFRAVDYGVVGLAGGGPTPIFPARYTIPPSSPFPARPIPFLPSAGCWRAGTGLTRGAATCLGSVQRGEGRHTHPIIIQAALLRAPAGTCRAGTPRTRRHRHVQRRSSGCTGCTGRARSRCCVCQKGRRGIPEAAQKAKTAPLKPKAMDLLPLSIIRARLRGVTAQPP